MGVHIGIDPTLVRTELEGPAFKLGSIGYEVDNPGVLDVAMGVTGGSATGDESCKAYMYVKAGGAITGAGYLCTINEAYDAAMLTTTTGAAGTLSGARLGVPMAAIADDGYGWVQIYGHGAVRGAASCVKYTQLYTTATAGVLDDTATAGFIRGLVLTETLTSAALADCVINYPIVAAV
jgi:hypothetical protein